MAFEAPIIIAKALDRIHRREYVLPAIQREFVWNPDKITRLFDSHMRGYAAPSSSNTSEATTFGAFGSDRARHWTPPSTMRESKDSSWRFPPLVAPPRSTLRPSPDGGVQPD